MICCVAGYSAGAGLCAGIFEGQRSGATGGGQVSFRTAVVPVLTKYCTGCHGSTKPKAGLNLASFRDETSARSNRKAWERVKEYVEGGLMPPEDRPQPSREELAQLTGLDQVRPES